MIRRTLTCSLCATLVGVALTAGCDTGPSGGSAAVGHDGKSATGHTGGGAAGGPNSPEAKAAAKKAAASR